MKVSLLDVPNFVKLFEAYLGKRIYFIFALAMLAGIADGFGILMLMPLLETLGASVDSVSPAEELTGPSLYMNDFLVMLGIEGSIIAILLLITFAFVVKGGLVFGALGLDAYLRGQLLRELKGRLFYSYTRMQFSYYCLKSTGHFTNIINEQVNRGLDSFHALSNLISHMLSAVIYLILAFAVAWRFGLMAVVAGVILLFLFRTLNGFVQMLSRKSASENGTLSKYLIEALQGFKYLVATNQLDDFRNRVHESVSRLTGYEVQTGIAQAFTNAAREPIAVTFVMSIVMVQLIIFEQELAPILISIVLFYRGMGALMQIQGYWQNCLRSIGSMEIVDQEFANQKKHVEKDGDCILKKFDIGINFRKVNFSYTPDLGNVLSDINLDVPARTSVAFVGQSGAGKSTMLDLITLMLSPTGGCITVDGVTGNAINKASWRGQIGYVSQDPVVFDASIADNICLLNGGIEKNPEVMPAILEAARQAHLCEFINSLPETYSTKVGDRGVLLSGGQKQRLVIARELFRKPKMLILDEATSALDSGSEKAIQKSIDELRGHITVIVIAHRLSTIRNVDCIYLLDKGTIVESGSYDALSTKEGSKFRELIQLQSL